MTAESKEFRSKSPENIQSASSSGQFSNKSIDCQLKGAGKMLHLDALSVLSDECQKVIDESITTILENPERLGEKIVADALEKASVEMKKQLREIKNSYTKDIQDEILKTEMEVRKNMAGKIEKERCCCERNLISALNEAQTHFQQHLKTVIQQVQKEQKAIWEEKFSKMKREFENKLNDLNQSTVRNKEHCVSQLQEKLQNETQEWLKQLRTEEQRCSNAKIKKLKQDQDAIIKKQEFKISKLEKEMKQLMQCLRDTITKKTEFDSEISKIKNLLTQFVKLANKTEKDPNYKAKIGEMLKHANINY